MMTSSESNQSGHNPQPAKDGDDRIPVIEWIVAAVGLLMLLGTLGFLVRSATAGDKSPPRVTVQVDSISSSTNPTGFLVQFRAINQGGTTAATVGITGELKEGDGDGTLESRSTELDYLPAHSTRLGGFFFTLDPRLHRLTLSSTGYQKP